jgi:hypothetical protein
MYMIILLVTQAHPRVATWSIHVSYSGLSILLPKLWWQCAYQTVMPNITFSVLQESFIHSARIMTLLGGDFKHGVLSFRAIMPLLVTNSILLICRFLYILITIMSPVVSMGGPRPPGVKPKIGKKNIINIFIIVFWNCWNIWEFIFLFIIN